MPKRKASTYDEVERRIRAAMWLAGLEFDDLAQRINTTNLGVGTLRRLNASRKPIATDVHFTAIAKACGLPYEFFTVDFARLPELTQPTTDELTLEERVRRLEGALVVHDAEAPARTEESERTSSHPRSGRQP